jgi:hypothetical protein
MKKIIANGFSFCVALLALSQCATAPNLKELPSPNVSVQPKRVMVLVFDQLRPDLIERFKMKHFLQVAREGISFPNAIVGHLGSVTVVSHPVITTGLLPKHLPWQDEFFRDDAGKLGLKGSFYSVLDLKAEQFKTLLGETKSTSLLSRLDSPNHSYVLGQKHYAVMGMAAPLTTSVITLGDKLNSPPGWRAPIGFQVPSFFTEPFLGRFYLDCNSSYGSEVSLYPLDGARFVQGNDESHLGGDAWVADGVKAIVEQDPDWKSIFATFGTIDKFLHILGEHDTPTDAEWAIKNDITLEKALANADLALETILKTLEEKGQLEETILVITADHGGQANKFFHGLKKPGLGTNYLFYARTQNKENIEIPQSLAPLFKNKTIDGISHDSALKIWTKNLNRLQLSKLAGEVSQLPGVAEVYTLQKTGKDYHYIRTSRSLNLKGKELEWANKHNSDLLESFAVRGGPNIVALLFDGHGYGFYGDHGGTQEWVQRVPLIIKAPNILPEKRGTTLPQEARLVDINPMVSRLLGLPLPKELDGSAAAIEGNFR